MLEDLKFLAFIIGIIGVFFLSFSLIGRKNKKKTLTSKFEKTIFEDASNKKVSRISLEQDVIEPSKSTKKSPTKLKNEEILSIIIRSRHKGGFRGKTLELALKKCGFSFGKTNIFHRYLHDNPEKSILYSVAQSVEPGTFDRENLKDQRIPGIVLFMVLNTETENTLDVFEQMLKHTRQLSASLNGELCDSRCEQLSSQTIAHYKEKIQENELRRQTQLVK